MPSTWRVHVIGEKLASEGIAAWLQEFDVYALPPELRHAVLNAVVAERAEFPMVLVNGTVACHGDVDLDAVVRAAQGVLARGGCY